MADVTISSLPQGAPSGNGLIPFSQSGTTYQTPISGIFQNRPAFNAVITQSRIRGPGVVPFDYVRFNVGGGLFDTTNYRYNVPVTGLYQINVISNYIDSTAGQGAGVYVRRNGVQHGTWIYATSTGSNWLNISGSETLSLTAGNYIDVYNGYNGYLDRSSPSTNSWWSSFSGYLIG